MKLARFLALSFAVGSIYLVQSADGIVLGESTPLTSALRDLRNNVAGLTGEESKRSAAFRQKTDELYNCEECRIPPHKRATAAYRDRSGRPSRSENSDLVESLQTSGVIRSPRVAAAMNQIDRGDFSDRSPYENKPQNIGYGVTISAPYMHAHALEALEPKLKPGARVLDVGAGSGYLTAAMSAIVGSTGKVVGIEHIVELTQNAIRNTRKSNAYMLDNGQLEFATGDGRLGYQPGAPYDAIHVGAAAASVPQPLINQLKPGGRLVIPVGLVGTNQMLEQIDKLPNGELKRQSLMLVRFVPLTSESDQWPYSSRRGSSWAISHGG